jgi:hypothetical protein
MLPLPLVQFAGEARAFFRLLGGDDDRRRLCPWRRKRGASENANELTSRALNGTGCQVGS